MSDCLERTMMERDQPECCDDCPLHVECALMGECGAINVLYPVGKPSLITQAKNLPILATRVAEDWLSSHSGNAKWQERLHYALGVKPLEWMDEWDEEYVHKHEYYFKEWVERTKKELGLDE